MPLESGANVGLQYVEEVTIGTTPPTPSMIVLRTTNRNINLEKDTLESEEVRSDRQLADFRHGFNRVVGSPGFELSLAAYDDFLRYALGGTWDLVTTASTGDVGITDVTNVIDRASGSWVTDGFRPGDVITASGFSNSENNIQFVVTAVAALDLTVADPGDVIITEAPAAGPSADVTGNRLDVGTALVTVSIERQFTGVTQYQVFAGCAINTLDMAIQPESIVGGSFGIVGMSSGAMTGTPLDAAPDAAPTNSPFDSFTGQIVEGGLPIAVVTGLEFNLDNGRTLEGVIGSKFSPTVFEGDARISGTLNAFFEDEVMFDKFVNETESSIYLKLQDLDGTAFMHLVFPRVKYSGASMDPPQRGPVVMNMPFMALVDATTGTSMSIQRSNV